MSGNEGGDIQAQMYSHLDNEEGIFVGRRTLDNEEDADELVKEIKNFKNLMYLCLSGNSVGVGAAKAISGALEYHSEFKRALWRDMFTKRDKDEIPKALQFLTSGVMLANAQLVELDLSDNALGPIGVHGLEIFLRSRSCYTLQILKLNNNGLGTQGSKMLANALDECYNNSEKEGSPLALKVFIVGRNRLENEGVMALSEIFEKMGSLEQLEIPQNGIYHAGISVLSKALKRNPNLRILNLNDNILTVKGTAALAQALPYVPQLKLLNLGDCLVRTKGALMLAQVMNDSFPNLEELHLTSNEIKLVGGLAIVNSLKNKGKLQVLEMDGNCFGEPGVREISATMTRLGKDEALKSLSDDEGDLEEEEEDDDDDEEDEEEEEQEQENESSVGSGEEIEEESIDNEVTDEEEEDDDDYEDEDEDPGEKATNNLKDDNQQMDSLFNELMNGLQTTLSLNDEENKVISFLQTPTADNFLMLGDNSFELIMKELNKYNDDQYLEKFLPALMKVSSLCENKMAKEPALMCSNCMYDELFRWTRANNKFSVVNNSLLVHLGLIKNEDKWKPSWNVGGCRVALDNVMQADFFPEDTKVTMCLFLERQVPLIDIESGEIIPS